MAMLINLIVVITSQCMYVSNHLLVYFKYVRFYLSIIPQFKKLKQGHLGGSIG